MKIDIHFIDATRKAYYIRIENTTMYFSFITMIGAEAAGQQVRLDNIWGTTTGKHINKLKIKEFEIVTDEELNDLVFRQFASDGINAFNKYFRQGIPLW